MNTDRRIEQLRKREEGVDCRSAPDRRTERLEVYRAMLAQALKEKEDEQKK